MDGKGELTNTAKGNETVTLRCVRNPKHARISKYWVGKVFFWDPVIPSPAAP